MGDQLRKPQLASQVERFPVMVTMDSHGRSLHDEVEERSRAKLRELLGFAV